MYSFMFLPHIIHRFRDTFMLHLATVHSFLLTISIPSYEYILCLSILLLVDTWHVSSEAFEDIIKLLQMFLCKYFWLYTSPFLLDKYLKVNLLGLSLDKLSLILVLETVGGFSKAVIPVFIPTCCGWEFQHSQCSPIPGVLSLSNFNHFPDYEMRPHCDFNFPNDADHVFISPLAICLFSFMRSIPLSSVY